MAKINKKSEDKTKVRNYMGEDAYDLHPKAKLVNLSATCMFAEPKYYDNVGDTVDKKMFKACEKVAKKDPEFILKLAKYLRHEMYLRSTPLALLVKAANLKEVKGTGLINKYAPDIIQRADELTEAIAMQIELFKKPIPNSLKKGIANSFKNFDEYQFAKYNNQRRDVKLRDVIMLTHPTEPSKIIKKILDDDLEVPYTWETELSLKGNKAEVWDELIKSKKLGYMATLRNLNNMIKSGTKELNTALDYISREDAVLRSKQLPHRYLSAYEAVTDNSSELFESDVDKGKVVKEAIEKAIKISSDNNIPEIPGKTIIICDNSGSARGDYGGPSKPSTKSVRTMADIGNLMGLLTWYSCKDTMFAVFGDRLTQIKPSRDEGIIKNFKAVDDAGSKVGGATENGVFLMLEKMIKDKIFTDRLIVCSDLQIGDGKNHEYGTHGRSSSRTVPKLVSEYRKKVNPNMIYYSVCFNGYGNDVIIGDKKVLITGWSDKIFKFINSVEQDSTTQVKYIEENF